MCYQPITIKNPKTGKFQQVPCGHCLECLKSYQNELVARLTEEYKACGRRAIFATLTYNEQSVPKNYFYKGQLYKSRPAYSYSNEKEFAGKRGGRLKHAELAEQVLIDEGIPVDKIVPLKWLENAKNRQLSPEVEDAIANDYPVQFLSVRRDDIKFAIEWFRRQRKDKKIRFFLTSEYGSHTERPHYHAVFFDEDMDSIRPFMLFWKNNFGFVDYSVVESEAALDYTTKYAAKGSFGNYFACKDYFYTRIDENGNPRHTEYHSKHYEYSLKFFGIDEALCDKNFRVFPKSFGECYLTPEKKAFHTAKEVKDYEQRMKRIIMNKKYTFENGRKVSLPKYYCEKIFNNTLKNKISRAVQQSQDFSFEMEYEVVEAENPTWTDYEVLREVLSHAEKRNDYTRRQASSFEQLNKRYKKDKF